MQKTVLLSVTRTPHASSNLASMLSPVRLGHSGRGLPSLAFLPGAGVEELTHGCPAIQRASADADLSGESTDGEIGMFTEQTEGQGFTVDGGSGCADGKQGLFITLKLGHNLSLTGGDGSQFGGQGAEAFPACSLRAGSGRMICAQRGLLFLVGRTRKFRCASWVGVWAPALLFARTIDV